MKNAARTSSIQMAYERTCYLIQLIDPLSVIFVINRMSRPIRYYSNYAHFLILFNKHHFFSSKQSVSSYPVTYNGIDRFMKTSSHMDAIYAAYDFIRNRPYEAIFCDTIQMIYHTNAHSVKSNSTRKFS